MSLFPPSPVLLIISLLLLLLFHQLLFFHLIEVSFNTHHIQFHRPPLLLLFIYLVFSLINLHFILVLFSLHNQIHFLILLIRLLILFHWLQFCHLLQLVFSLSSSSTSFSSYYTGSYSFSTINHLLLLRFFHLLHQIHLVLCLLGCILLLFLFHQFHGVEREPVAAKARGHLKLASGLKHTASLQGRHHLPPKFKFGASTHSCAIRERSKNKRNKSVRQSGWPC